MSDLNLDDFIISTDEGTGELVLGKAEAKPTETPQEPVPQTPDPEDKFSAFEGKINGLMDIQQRQSNAISTLIQALMQKETPVETVDPEVLGDMFSDPDKGKNFLNVIEKSIERIIDSKFGQLQPVIQQSSIKAELDQLANSVPDLPLYAQGMHQLLGINPNLTFQQAYSLAKQYGWKTEPTKGDQNQVQQTNVADINQRRNLPQKLDSSNGALKTKEVKSVRDALDAALEELGA